MLRQRSLEQPGSLFPLTTNFRVVKLKEVDATNWSDNLKMLKGLIDVNEEMYPNIDRWFVDKVVPGIRSAERVAWIAFEGEKAIAAAVLKRGKRTKFCHVRIQRDYQDVDLGQLFFTQMILETRLVADEIHFTLPESLWQTKRNFFHSFGFSQAIKASRQYRRGEMELACSAPHRLAQRAALERLPALGAKFNISGYALGGNILISVKPKYAEGILAGSKHVEIRKRFSKNWVGCKAILYASSPQKALVGEATIRRVSCGAPSEIWAMFGPSINCSSEEFEKYVGSHKEVSAVELIDVIPYLAPISLTQVSHLIGEELRPPQSFCDLRLDKQQSGWSKAVSAASLLHGSFSRPRHTLAAIP